MGNAANEAKQKRLECRRSPAKRLNLGSQTEGEWGSDNSGEGYCRFDLISAVVRHIFQLAWCEYRLICT